MKQFLLYIKLLFQTPLSNPSSDEFYEQRPEPMTSGRQTKSQKISGIRQNDFSTELESICKRYRKSMKSIQFMEGI